MGAIRDRRMGVAVVVSLLLHVVLVWLLPRTAAVMAVLLPAPAPAVPAVPEPDDRPIRFELVELPDQQAEEPSRFDSPGSDLSRRAHGGEGDRDDAPGVRGSTYELRLAPGSPAQVPPAPAPGQPEARPLEDPAQREPQARQPSDSGATVIKPLQTEPKEQSRPVLKGLSPLSQPPSAGGAIPDRQGGEVDLGPLSFDTQWYDWGPYAAEMLRRIRYHWRIPEIAQLGVQGVVRIRFLIERDGRVTGLEIQRESSHPPMDFAARDAILDASPLPPLPIDLTGVEREGVTITFYYNVRPPDRGR